MWDLTGGKFTPNITEATFKPNGLASDTLHIAANQKAKSKPHISLQRDPKESFA